MAPEMNSPWTLSRKLAFRFFFPFFILSTSIWNFIPVLDQWASKFYYYPSFFVQNYILKLTETPRWVHDPTGNGDTLDDWILLLTYGVLSAVICIIWSVLDRKRTAYTRLESGLQIGLRYYLAFVMFGYGIDKLFLLQMPYPSLAQLHTPLGEFTPMRLTWMHIGYSAPYQFMGGFLETLGGALILFRRTKVLGGVLLLSVLTQVVMLNYFYGVPVKIFSTLLLIMTIYILKDHLKALIFFMLGRPHQAIVIQTFQSGKVWLNKVRPFVKGGFVIFAVGGCIASAAQAYTQRASIEKIPVYGAYAVSKFIQNSRELSLSESNDRWNFVVFGEGLQDKTSATLIRRGISDYQKAWTTLSATDSIRIEFSDTTIFSFNGRYSRSEAGVELLGKVDGDSVIISLTADDKNLTLPNRKFRWVLEQKDF
jgi:hypothetical protein